MSPVSYHQKIVTDGEVFSESFQPRIIHVRESHVRELISYLSGDTGIGASSHTWLYGPTGSGKTCIVRYVLEELNKRFNIRSAYVNCWNHLTSFSILQKVEKNLRLLGSENNSTTVKLGKIAKAVGPKPFILVLDEIDKVAPRERNAILYKFAEIANLNLICIASNRHSFHILEDRVKSRLNPMLLEFKTYTDIDLVTISRYRAELGLNPDAWSERILRRISILAAGDARYALQMLTISSRLAEKDGCKVIKDKHINEAWNQARELNSIYALCALSEHHKLLFQLVKQKGEVLSGELWQLYLKKCKARRIKPIAIRTFSEYMNRLIREGLINGNRAQSRGRVRIFSIVNQGRN